MREARRQLCGCGGMWATCGPQSAAACWLCRAPPIFLALATGVYACHCSQADVTHSLGCPGRRRCPLPSAAWQGAQQHHRSTAPAGATLCMPSADRAEMKLQFVREILLIQKYMEK